MYLLYFYLQFKVKVVLPPTTGSHVLWTHADLEVAALEIQKQHVGKHAKGRDNFQNSDKTVQNNIFIR